MSWCQAQNLRAISLAYYLGLEHDTLVQVVVNSRWGGGTS